MDFYAFQLTVHPPKPQPPPQTPDPGHPANPRPQTIFIYIYIYIYICRNGGNIQGYPELTADERKDFCRHAASLCGADLEANDFAKTILIKARLEGVQILDLFKRRLEFLFIPTGTFQPAIDDLNVLTVIWEPEASKFEKKKKSSRRSTLSLLRNSSAEIRNNVRPKTTLKAGADCLIAKVDGPG